MESEATQISVSPAAVRSQLRRAHGDVDGRSAPARRARTIMAVFAGQLGGTMTALQMLRVKRAAEFTVAAEDMRAKLLRGEAVDTDKLLRFEGACDRAVRRLGLPSKREQQPAQGETFTDVAARAQAEAGTRRAVELAVDEQSTEQVTSDSPAAKEGAA